MYLKQLEIHGFKSFSDKVKLEFNKGITAVVGPNGSGKSNVSDSVRWVLGEQKAKSLRGDKMEDIIFSGTETRKPLGFAEVSITIDNQDQKMPIAYTEVTVTRRVYRSGESEYQINGTNCRLKDIHELFMDTGVGREGYSIIGQGRIDEILSAKADDRRRIFEEAAGIVKYKVRKNEAISKLEKEQQNLVRIEDIISELESQIDSLEEQSKKAKNYIALKEKIKQASLSMFCTDIENLEKEFLKQQQYQETVLQNKQNFSQQIQQNTEQYQQIQQHYEQIEKQMEQIQQQMISTHSHKQKMESDVELTEQQIQHFLQNITRMQKEQQEKQQQMQQCQYEKQLLSAQMTAVEVSAKSAKQQLAQQEALFEQLNSTVSESEKNIEEYKSDMVEQIRISTEAKGDISQRQILLEQFQKRQNQLSEEKHYLKDQIHTQNVHQQVLSKKRQELEQQIQQIQKQLSELEQNNNDTTQKKQILFQQQKIREQQLSQKRSRFSVLSEMEKEHEGFFKSVKSILHLKSVNEKWQGICGAVAELLHVSEKYESAIETALGSNLQNIVTKTEYDAKEAIQYLKQNHLGRATFLPISAIKGRKLAKDAILSENGVLGIASDLVQYDSIYENIVNSLLGRTIIIQNLDIAVALAKKYNYQYRIVTLEGDLLNAGGAMTGGSTAKKATSIFGRSREINELSENIKKENELLQNCQNEILLLETQLSQISESILQKRMNIQELQLSYKQYQQEQQNTQQLLQEKEQKQKLYDLEQSQLSEQQQQAQQEVIQFQNTLQQSEKKINEINQKLSAFQNSMSEEKEQREQILNRITELKVSLSAEEQNKKAIQDSIKRLQQQNILLQREQKQIEQEIKSFQQQIEQKQIQKQQFQKQIDADTEQEQKQQIDFSAISQQKEAVKDQISILEQKEKECNKTISQLENELFRIETKQQKIEEEKQRLYNEIWEEYEMTHDMIKQQYSSECDYTKLKSDCKKWKNEIKELGNVNVSAIENYKEVKTRYEFLNAQKTDILEAEQKLHILIDDLSEMMENQFREQFSAISNNFSEVFREMFGGGKAYLKLSDETKVLESSIEIIAQPPGKSLQSMQLLSGGERALTAIAILFSILKMKPSPFCILDEIEAALDDANVKRYADYLKKFSKDTQFIVITHRKGTMEAADVMYGVTMQEKGVSKMISVNFEDKAYL